MTGNGVIQKFLNESGLDLDTIRCHLTGERGLGQKIIVKFLDGTPGINDGSVQQQLASLKASGDYARIIKEVSEDIERENKQAF